MRPYPPLGILYISAYLKDLGFSVEIHDPTMGRRSELENRLVRDAATVLGIYTTMMTRASVLRIAARANALGWTVVVGGPDAGNYAAEYLEHGAHVVVRGEGEETLRELLETLPRRGPHRLQGIRGITFSDEEGRAVANPGRALIADLDSLPLPDREAIDIDAYLDVWKTHHGMGSVNLITSRGCAYRCNWCSHAVFGHSHRRRSAVGAADEVESIVRRYDPDQLWYSDDVFTISRKWLRTFALELDRRGIHRPFETITRADRMKGDEVVRTLAELGCYRVWIGAESGSQRILDAMDRGVTTDEIDWAVSAAKRAGIETGLFLMWGYEGEQFEDVEATVEFVSRVQPDIFFTTLAYPIKDTGYYRKVEDRVVRPGPWAEISDREHGVRGRPGREHFRPADRWLRAAAEAASLTRSDPPRANELEEEAALAKEEFREACHRFEAES
ncbi:MAG: B12-binding domain-containing radical SAM protein [Gemmatimonadetes bacterium]|nr:B12-binding domain-containing radical SAM protein [Gemmatimonadota bacterium]